MNIPLCLITSSLNSPPWLELKATGLGQSGLTYSYMTYSVSLLLTGADGTEYYRWKLPSIRQKVTASPKQLWMTEEIAAACRRLGTPPLAAVDACASAAVHAGTARPAEAPKYPAEYSSVENLLLDVCSEQAPVITAIRHLKTASKVTLILNDTVSQKTTPFFIFVISSSDFTRFCYFLAETYPRKFEACHRRGNRPHEENFTTGYK